MTSDAIRTTQPTRLSVRTGVLGVVLMGLWLVAGTALMIAIAMSLDPDRLNQYGGRILSGFVTTIRICAASLVAGAIISLPVAAGRLSDNRFLGALAYGYSYFFRGTPLIAQLFLIYYGAGQFASELRSVGLWWFFRDALNCAVFAFALNTAAYQAEILAGAIRGVPHGQREAATALGLSRFTSLWKIILPQALILALRPYGNEIILIVKASAITSLVTVLDLMGQTRYIFSRTYDLSYYLWAAVFYLIIVETLRRLTNRLEARLTRHLKPTTTGGYAQMSQASTFQHRA